LISDPAAAQAWLRQSGDTHHGVTRAENLGVDDELTAPGRSCPRGHVPFRVLPTGDDVAAHHPSTAT
jgi:hypothetical protein